MEEWKAIEGYEGRYEVSTEGRVRGLKKAKKILKPSIVSGYYRVGLHKLIDGKRHVLNCLVHRLVASAFIQNQDNKPQVDHIDGNRLNNCASNLRWVTASENHANVITKERMIRAQNNPELKAWNGRRLNTPEIVAKRTATMQTAAVREKMGVKSRKPVRCVDTGEIYPSASAAAIANSVSVSAICASCKCTARGRQKPGYHHGSRAPHFEYLTNQ